MTRRGVIGLLSSAASLVLLAACGPGGIVEKNLVFFYTPHHARLTAVVDTPQGEKTGSSVIEVKWSVASYEVTGEAVAVDIAPGQTLFVLLRSASDVDWIAYVSRNMDIPKRNEGEPLEHEFDWIAADRRVWPIKRRWKTVSEDYDNYPYFVRFRNMADPTSVEQVDPDNLAASFGKGVKLKSLTVQMTDEPVTVGIEKRFSWWRKYINRHFDETSTVSEDLQNKSLAAHLSAGSFSTEYMK